MAIAADFASGGCVASLRRFRPDGHARQVILGVDVQVTPGAYRLFLDFQHGGVARTASFTATA